MENLFKGFHNPSNQSLVKAWSADDTLFIFDTNVFLNLYSYADQTRNDFFDVLEKLNGNLWIPYHVGLEYQFRRLEIIKNEKSVFSNLRKALNKIEKIFEDDIKKLSLEKRFPKLHDNATKLQKEITKSITAFNKSVTYWDEKQPCVRSHDTIRERINKIFKNKVGDPPQNQEELNKIYEDGEIRYENKIPPGYKDNGKSSHESPYFFYNSLKYERRFGDLIIWKQIIEKAKEDGINNVIFVTDDSKEDWWYILDSRGKKKIGPHANLQCEIFEETNIELFFMYNTSSFLEDGKRNLEIGVHESSIQDANSRFWEKKATRTLLSNKDIDHLYLLNKKHANYIDHINIFEIFNKIKKDKENYLDEINNIELYYKKNKHLFDDLINNDIYEKYIDKNHIKDLIKNEIYEKCVEKNHIKNWHTHDVKDSDLSKIKEIYKKMMLLNLLKSKIDDEE